MQCRRDQSGAGRTDRVAQRNSTSVDIDLVHVCVVDLRPGQNDRGKRLIDFNQIDIVEVHACLLEQGGGGVHWSIQQEIGVGAHNAVGENAGAWFQPASFGFVSRHPQHRSGAVGNL